MNGGVDVIYAFLEGTTTGTNGISQTVSNQGLTLSGRVMSQITFKNGWGIQVFGGGRGAQVQLQGRQGGFGMYSLGVKKEFKNKKGSIGLAGENFLTNTTGIMRTELNSAMFSQVSTTNLYNRGVKLTLNYKLGSMTFNERKKTRSVKNDDIKDGGGDGGNDNGGGQQQSAPQSRPQGQIPTPTKGSAPTKSGQ